MPIGVYKHKPLSKETKQKMSESRKGKKNCNFGKTFSEEHRKRLSDAHKGKIQSEETKNKRSNSLLGHKVSLETRIKIEIAHSGCLCSFWKGGIYPNNKILRTSIKIKKWRKNILENNDYTCQKTCIKGGKLVAHHIQNFAQFPELRFVVDNGITLSKQSHIEFHKIYGLINNTLEQIEEFIKRKYKYDI